MRSTRGRATAPLARMALLLGAAAAVAACDGGSTEPEAGTSEQVAFIDNIVPHHLMANMMADDAIAKAVHPWLRTFAQNMKVDQTREIGQYREIRRQLVGSDTTPDPMMSQPIPAGPNFDREWILMMVDHHQGAINNSLLAHGSGVESRLDSLAHHTIDEQRKEQQELLDSLRVWYP